MPIDEKNLFAGTFTPYRQSKSQNRLLERTILRQNRCLTGMAYVRFSARGGAFKKAAPAPLNVSNVSKGKTRL